MPLTDVTFAEEAGRAVPGRNGRSRRAAARGAAAASKRATAAGSAGDR